jgi:hypothetical protein
VRRRDKAHPTHQGGYLYEIPLIVILTGLLAGLLGPHLEPPWSWLLWGLFAAAWMVFLLYGRNRR